MEKGRKKAGIRHLQQGLIPVDGFLYNVLAVRGKPSAGVFVKVAGVDGIPVFQDHMGLTDLGKMALKDGDGVVHADGDNGAVCLFRDLKGTAVEGQET